MAKAKDEPGKAEVAIEYTEGGDKYTVQLSMTMAFLNAAAQRDDIRTQTGSALVKAFLKAAAADRKRTITVMECFKGDLRSDLPDGTPAYQMFSQRAAVNFEEHYAEGRKFKPEERQAEQQRQATATEIQRAFGGNLRVQKPR